MGQNKVTIKYSEYNKIDQVDEDLWILHRKASEIAKTAYAPYSRFKVGAGVLLENGGMLFGSNQENAAFPSGLCAERVAVNFANSAYPDQKVIAIAIYAYSVAKKREVPVSPCGSCRQVLLETEKRYGHPIKILFYWGGKYLVFNSVSDILPFGF